jgi:hypothetical protein
MDLLALSCIAVNRYEITKLKLPASWPSNSIVKLPLDSDEIVRPSGLLEGNDMMVPHRFFISKIAL